MPMLHFVLADLERRKKRSQLSPDSGDRGVGVKHLHAHADASNNADENWEKNVRGNVLRELAPGVMVLSELALVVSVVAVVAVVAMLSVTALTIHAVVLATAAVLSPHIPQDGSAPLAVESGAGVGRALSLILLGRRDGGFGGLDVGNHELAGGGLDQFDVDVRNVANEAVAYLNNLQVDLKKLELLVIILGHGADTQTVTQLRCLGIRLARVLGGGFGESGNLRSTKGGVPGRSLGVKFEIVDEEVVEAVGVGFDGECELEVVLNVGQSVVATIVMLHRQGASGAVELDKLVGDARLGVGLLEGKGVDDVVVGFGNLGDHDEGLRGRERQAGSGKGLQIHFGAIIFLSEWFVDERNGRDLFVDGSNESC